MNNLGQGLAVRHEPVDTLRAVESIRLLHQPRRGNNLSMGAKASGSFTLTRREDALENTLGTNRPMLLNLRSKGRAVPPSASSTTPGYGLGVAEQADGLMASSISVMHHAEPLRDGAGNVGKSVQLGQGEICGIVAAKGSVTRYERIGASSKAVRWVPLGHRMADLRRWI